MEEELTVVQSIEGVNIAIIAMTLCPMGLTSYIFLQDVRLLKTK